MNPGPDHKDRREEFVGLLMRHDYVIRAYIRSMVYALTDVDDLMQEVSIAAWRNFERLDSVENFRAWVCGIARIELLRFRRKMAHNRMILGEELEQLIGEEGLAELDVREHELKALETCVKKLPERQRVLIFDAYGGDNSIKRMAESLGKTPDAIYQVISRTRRQLLKCIEQTIAKVV